MFSKIKALYFLFRWVKKYLSVQATFKDKVSEIIFRNSQNIYLDFPLAQGWPHLNRDVLVGQSLLILSELTMFHFKT